MTKLQKISETDKSNVRNNEIKSLTINDLNNDFYLNDTSFPVSSFPKKIQEIIFATRRTLNFPIDFMAASILYAASVAIGNAYKVVIKKGFEMPCVLYLALVGQKGTTKTHPLVMAIKPLIKIDSRDSKIYESQKEAYDRYLDTPKKERDISEMSKPKQKKKIVQDFTPESLQSVHHDNPRGLGAYNDELISWTNNFGRYSKGSEEQFWLSNWSGTFTDVARQNRSLRINNSFISVAGTIQPSILKTFADGRIENGFLDRVLFAYPKNLQKSKWSLEDIDEGLIEQYHDIINDLLSLDYDEDEIMPMFFNPNARAKLFAWQELNTDKANKATDLEKGIYSKLESYLPRIAMILQLLGYACGECDKDFIDEKSIENAIKVVDYFEKTAKRVYGEVLGYRVLDDLNEVEKKLYEGLPKEFTRKQAIELISSLKLNVVEKTIDRYLENDTLYRFIKRGTYEKNYFDK